MGKKDLGVEILRATVDEVAYIAQKLFFLW